MNGHSVLAALAKGAGIKVRHQIMWSGPIQYDSELRLRRSGHAVVVRANADRVYVQDRIESAIVFAAGAPGLMYRVPVPNEADIALFRGDASDVDPRPWLADSSNAELVSSLPLAQGRRLEVVRNMLVWEGVPADLSDAPAVIDALSAVADALPQRATEQRSIAGELPPDLEDLRSLVPKWAISDDEARTARMRQRSTVTLAKLWATVGPQLAAIDRFIAQTPATGDDDAAALGDLAQAALEARAILESRGAPQG
jgi:hypothetical protein